MNKRLNRATLAQCLIKPTGAYQEAELKAWARRIDDWRDQGLDVFVYFNDVAGYALQNARTLKRLLAE
ncbi:MAG: DUF72 domain-containing protein [Anaerolineae bacterium]|nr:DUF72 domain-containing protein [Anaerolineae bacterium]